MRLRRFSWRWWLLGAGSVFLIVGAIGIFTSGGKTWMIFILIGVVLTMVGNPIWAGLRAPKDK